MSARFARNVGDPTEFTRRLHASKATRSPRDTRAPHGRRYIIIVMITMMIVMIIITIIIIIIIISTVFLVR